MHSYKDNNLLQVKEYIRRMSESMSVNGNIKHFIHPPSTFCTIYMNEGKNNKLVQRKYITRVSVKRKIHITAPILVHFMKQVNKGT